MRMEFDGREVLWVIFGVPALTAAMIWATVFFTRPSEPEPVDDLPVIGREASNAPVHLSATLEMPEGAVVVNNANNLPAPEIHHHEKEIIEREKFNAPNVVEVAFHPSIQWFSEIIGGKATLVPSREPVKKEAKKPESKEGALLPPPKP